MSEEAPDATPSHREINIEETMAKTAEVVENAASATVETVEKVATVTLAAAGAATMAVVNALTDAEAEKEYQKQQYEFHQQQAQMAAMHNQQQQQYNMYLQHQAQLQNIHMTVEQQREQYDRQQQALYQQMLAQQQQQQQMMYAAGMATAAPLSTSFDSMEAGMLSPDSSPVKHHGHGHGHDDEEGLGEDFEETQWVPPSLTKATEYRHHTIFRGGTATHYHTNMCRSPDLGNGTVMYFQFMRSMGVCMFVCTLLSVPTLYFAWSGARMPLEDQDSFNFFKFALGNIGYDTQSSTFAADSECRQPMPYYNKNETCLQLPQGQEISLSAVGSILTLMELLQCLVFFFTIWHLKNRLKSVVNELSKDVTTVTDYSIMIRNIPPGTTEKELIEHFSNLYPLDRPDWKGRPGLTGATPVQEVDNTHESRYIGTWVAECFLMRKIGKLLNSFLAQDQVTVKLRRSRAEAKMWAPDTCHAKGPNNKKHGKAMKKVEKYALKIDALAQSVFDVKGFKLEDGDGEVLSSKSKATRLLDQFRPVCAFIIFQYSESMARCVEDSEKYSVFPYTLCCYPQQLLFKGKKLKICQAPDPEQLLYENMEVPFWKKFISRLFTNAVGFVLLLICFVIIVQGSIYKNKFANEIPNLGFCSTVVPMGYAMAEYDDVPDWSSYSLYRPPAGDVRTSLDAQCNDYNAGSFYAVMALSSATYNQTLVSYNISSCEYTKDEYDGLCPNPTLQKNDQYCPCVSITSEQTCHTYYCYEDPVTSACKKYEAKLVGSCYCYDFLLNMISTEGVSGTIDYIKGAKNDVCYPFFINYSKATGITYGTTVITVVINMILKYCLTKLTKYEYHVDLDKAQASLMIKAFISTFFNMAVVVLIAFGFITGTPEALKRASIFQGIYPDFTSAWYGVVGAYLVLTYAIQVISAPIADFVNFLLVNPFTRCITYPSISSQSSTKILMQDDLNALEVNQDFDIVTNTAQMTTLVFFAMLYASGLPLLIPVACVTFISYFFLYKTLVLRFYKKPPRVGAAIIETVIGIMPYAAILRLLFACWMLGNTAVLPATFPIFSGGAQGVSGSTSDYLDFLAVAKENAPSNPSSASLITRLSQPNVFPLAVLAAFIILVRLILKLWPYLPVAWVQNFFKWCYKGHIVNTVEGYDLLKDNWNGLRQEMAPFTGTYFSYMSNKDEVADSCSCNALCASDMNTLTEAEEMDGFVRLDQGKYVVKCKQFNHSATVHGITRQKGELKKTYEVIRDVGVCSYQLKNIPRYRLAWHTLVEGAINVDEYQAAKRQKEKDRAAAKERAKAEKEAAKEEKKNKNKSKTKVQGAEEVANSRVANVDVGNFNDNGNNDGLNDDERDDAYVAQQLAKEVNGDLNGDIEMPAKLAYDRDKYFGGSEEE